MKLELEPTIGNHDQEFVDTWYSNLQEFSLTLMKGIVKFCDKKISETTAHINLTENIKHGERRVSKDQRNNF